MKIIVICILFATAFAVTCGWYAARLQNKEAQRKADEDADRKARAWLVVNDTVEVSRVRNDQTGLTATFNKQGQIIDTFTELPVLDSLLINHSKIP